MHPVSEQETALFNASFCATLVDEWARSAATQAFVSPGSRSTPLILALEKHPTITVNIFLDERSAAFAALGNARATQAPTIIACTSGTAAAHFHAAIIEANLSGIPLLVCTADRPPELWDIGAPQSINQTQIFGNNVRFFAEPGPPTEENQHVWRPLASRAINEAYGRPNPGPVHLNLSFREPLTGEAKEIPEGRPEGKPWHIEPRHVQTTHDTATEQEHLANKICNRNGIIIAGQGTTNPETVIKLAEQSGWPLFADHQSGCRSISATQHFHSLLATPTFAEKYVPETIIRFGKPLTSKPLTNWIKVWQEKGSYLINAQTGNWCDPENAANYTTSQTSFGKQLIDLITEKSKQPSTWAAEFAAADKKVKQTISQMLRKEPVLTEPHIAQTLTAEIPSQANLVVSSSMPVRTVEWFGINRTDIDVFCNRGANGIDGVLSTAVGTALTQKPTFLLIGDIAFLHDSSALSALAQRDIDLTIIIVDNNGGGIFSFLPQASLLEKEQFNKLFTTPHNTNITDLLAAHSIPTTTWGLNETLQDCLHKLPSNKTKAIVAQVPIEANNIHETIHQAVKTIVY